MNRLFFLLFALLGSTTGFGQSVYELVFPDSINWNVLNEGQTLSFQLTSTYQDGEIYYSIENKENLNIQFDSIGNFLWTPSYDLVDRVEQSKEFTLIFQGRWNGEKRIRKSIDFIINHTNRPPDVEELPVFYVKQSSENSYQIQSDYVQDPDGDPVVFRSIPSQMPEGLALSSQGQISWKPSRSQFYSLRGKPFILEFLVQDQPFKAETKGRLKIAQTQLDLPPELLVVPGDTSFTVKEDETLNLKLYVSDPNGDENVRSVGFIPDDLRIQTTNLKQNTPLQYEFTWMPGYDFVEEVQKDLTIEMIFFALDESNNRVQKRISVKVVDTENIEKKDALQYGKYRSNLVSSMLLIHQLDEHQKKLNGEYKRAKKGKKKRSILNASLGAATGLSPTMMEPDQSRVVSTVGGTTVLTLNTLEATEVIGKSKDDIMDKIKITIDIRNKVQAAGDEFARRYALKSERRKAEFEKDIDKFRTVVNDQRIVLLEMDAYRKNAPRADDKEIKKTFPDYAGED